MASPVKEREDLGIAEDPCAEGFICKAKTQSKSRVIIQARVKQRGMVSSNKRHFQNINQQGNGLNRAIAVNVNTALNLRKHWDWQDFGSKTMTQNTANTTKGFIGGKQVEGFRLSKSVTRP